MDRIKMGIVSAMMFLGTIAANAQGFHHRYDRYDREMARREMREDMRDRRAWEHRMARRDREMARRMYDREMARRYRHHHGPRHVVVERVVVATPPPPPPPRYRYRRHSDGSLATGVAIGTVLGAVIATAAR